MTCHCRRLIICLALSYLIQGGQTALHMACYEGHVGTVTELLKGGAKIDLKDNVRLLYVHVQSYIDKMVFR